MSLGQQTQAGIHSLVANTLGAAAGAAGGGPVASALVSGLVNLLWPASQADVWDSIRDDVQNLINQSLDADEVATIAATLTGLKKALNDYNNEVNSPNPDSGGILQYYRITKETFDTNSPAFQKEGYQVLLLPQYAQMMNLYLALMRDGVLYGNTWKMPSDEININQADQTAAVNAAVGYVNQWVSAGVPAPVIDPNASPQISSHAAATAYLTSMTIGVLDQQKLWPYFDPSQFALGTLPPKDPREIFSDSFWRVPPRRALLWERRSQPAKLGRD